MALDASIYGMIRPQQAGPGPLDQYAQIAQVRGLMNANDLNALKKSEMERSIAAQGKMRDLFSRGGVKPEEVMAIDPATGMQFAKNRLDSQKTEAELQKLKIETFGAATKQLRDLTATVQDDAGMMALKDNAVRLFGPDIAAKMNIPQTFDPAWKNAQILTADKLLDQLEAARTREVTVRGQDLSAATARRGQDMSQATAVRGQDLSAATATRGQNITAATTQRGQDLVEGRERDLTLQGGIAQAREGGKDRAEAMAKLPQAISNAERALRLVDEMVGTQDGEKKPHPGFRTAVGATMMPGARFVPGSDAADFQARLDEIKGGAFLQAFETLKGGGQITQIEGEKATSAITRMNTSQSEREFIAAAREFQNVVRDALKRAQKKTGAPAATPGATGSWGEPAPNPGGIKFLGFE